MIKDKFYWVETNGGHCPVYTLFPESSSPVVMFCHDYKGSSQEENRFFWKLSRALYKQGIGSVRFDYNGFGNSTGDSTVFTIESGLKDTVAIFQQIAGMDSVDSDKLAILGLGMGGRMAAYLLGNSPDLKAGILLNPANTHFKSDDELQELEFGFEGNTTWDGGWEFSKELFDAESFGEGAEDIADTDADLLIVSSYDDEFIKHNTSEPYIEQVPMLQFEEVLNADHYFSSPDAEEEVTEIIINFLKKSLLGIEEKDEREKESPPEKLEITHNPPLAEQFKD